MYEEGVFATNRDTFGHQQIISVNAGRWIISQPPRYLQTITLKNVTPCPRCYQLLYLALF